LAANGRTVLVDPGTYTYTGSKELRDWFRSSHAHNTVTLDGHSSSAPNGAFSWTTTARCSLQQWISQERFDFVSGRHDGFMRLQNPAMVSREILFLKHDYWIMRDALNSSAEHRLDVRFHFESTRQREASLDIQCFGNGQFVEEEAFLSHCYGQKEQSKAIGFSATLRDGEDVISFLFPRQAGIEWRVIEMEAEEGRAFEISREKIRDVVMIRSGQWLWKRFVDGELQESVSPPTQTFARTSK
jgi:hypothetical protein